MVTREYVTNYLRLNGISDTLSTQALSSELINIGWSQGDVADAVRALRGDVATTGVSEVNKMLYSDSTLSSNAVTSLLNIHIKHQPKQRHSASSTGPGTAEVSHTIAAIAVAVVVAGVTFTAAMFLMKIGPFFS